MTAGVSRLTVFGIWFGTLFLCITLLFLCVPLRQDIGFRFADAFQLATPVTSLYIPILTMFALFWFHPGRKSSRRKLSKEKWIAALALTLFFQIFMITGLAGITLYSTPAPDSSVGLFEEVSALVQWISIFSPVATAPAAFLLGVEQIATK